MVVLVVVRAYGDNPHAVGLSWWLQVMHPALWLGPLPRALS